MWSVARSLETHDNPRRGCSSDAKACRPERETRYIGRVPVASLASQRILRWVSQTTRVKSPSTS